MEYFSGVWVIDTSSCHFVVQKKTFSFFSFHTYLQKISPSFSFKHGHPEEHTWMCIHTKKTHLLIVGRYPKINIKGIYYNNVLSLEARISSETKALLIYTCCGIDPSYIHKDYAILNWHIEKGYPVFTKSNESLKLLMISIHPMSALPKMVRNKILPSKFFYLFF